MASMKRPRLKGVQPRSGASLELTFTNGQHFTLDMSDALKTYPGLAPLSTRCAFESFTMRDGAAWKSAMGLLRQLYGRVAAAVAP